MRSGRRPAGSAATCSCGASPGGGTTIESYRTLKRIILGRRSIRRFREEPVPEGLIREVLDCARWAPSDTNRQPWQFIIMRDPELLAAVERITAGRLETLRRQALDEGKPVAARKLGVFARYAIPFAGAPVLIFVVAHPYRSRFTEEIFDGLMYPEVWKQESLKSVCFAAQNLLLAAHALGLGACPMSGPVLLAGEQLKSLLKLDPESEIVLVIALGRPLGRPKTSGRKPVDEVTVWY